MSEHIPGWTTDAYDRLWSRSEDFTAERHGLTVLTCPPPSCVGQPVIAVRDEYLELWDFLKEAHCGKHFGGVVLTGHPGAGKFCFLLYAFARALREHVPVAFCNSPSEYYYCDRMGCRLYETNGEGWHQIVRQDGKFSLALVASSESLPIPPYKFIDQSQMCFTVQATSPQSALLRCRRWVREREAYYWVIQPWTENEVRKLQHFYEEEGPHPWKDDDTYYSPLETFALLGPSIRKCFFAHGNRKTAHGPAHDFEAFLRPDEVFDNMDEFIAALKDNTLVSPQLGLDFHRFFVVSKPWDVSNPMQWTLLLLHSVPTLFLQRLLAARFRLRTTNEQVALVSKFTKSSSRKALSFVYDPAILDALCRPSTLTSSSPGAPSPSLSPNALSPSATVPYQSETRSRCKCRLADGTRFALGPGLVLADEQVTSSTASVVLRDNHIYLLRSGSGFPWIDAFVVSENLTRVTLLQTTVHFRREVVSSAVRGVIELVQRSMPKRDSDSRANAAIKWSFVFVTPGRCGERLARTLVLLQFLREGQPTVVAGWLEIGALLGYPQEVLDALQKQDAESVGEEIDDYGELQGGYKRLHKATWLEPESRSVDWNDPPFGLMYGGT